MADDVVRIVYDDFTLDEIVEFEKVSEGCPFTEMVRGRPTGAGLRAAVWLVRRRTEPGLTIGQVGNVTAGKVRFGPEVNAPDPTNAAD